MAKNAPFTDGLAEVSKAGRAAPSAAEADTKYVVPGLDRGLRLLSLFTKADPELSLSEINQRVDLPYATTYRLLHTLEMHGLLVKARAGFRLGPGILRLGFDYLASLDIVELSRPAMVALRDATGAAANLGILNRTEVIYIAHVPSTQPLSTRMVAGSRLPAYGSSIGRLIIGSMHEDEVRRIFKGVNLKTASGQISSISELIKITRKDWERGYVISKGFYDVGITAVAAPIFDRTGKPIAGINISGPSSSLDNKDLTGDIKKEVFKAASIISELMGYRPN